MKPTTARAFITMALLLAGVSATPAWAGFFDVETKLTASDAAAGDNFGNSVAISGTTALVGALGDDDGGNQSGSAYLFDVTTGNQLFKLNANDAAEFDGFGYSVAISGNTALVGARGDEHGGIASGSAYLFDVTTGNQLFKLSANDAADFDNFGNSVAISGNTALVGAKDHEDGGNQSGSAYLFDVTTGNQLFKLSANDIAARDQFGWSVAISGNTALVGAYHDDDGGVNSGSAYLFDVTTGNQVFKLNANDAAEFDGFGYSVAISGNTALVGARDDDGGGQQSGSAYLFDVTTGNQLFKLNANDAAAGDRFGYSVAISGNTALVGARDDDDGGNQSGSAYLFDGNQVFKLNANDAAEGDQFGNSVAISGTTALVGTFGNDDGGNDSGAAYLFGSSFVLSWNQLGPGTFGYETAANWTPSETPRADTDVLFTLDGDVDVIPFSTSVANNVTFSDGVVRLKSLGSTTFTSSGSVTVGDPLAANLGDGAFATLDGTNGHTWTTSFNLQVGNAGYGTFIVNNGGDFDAQRILVGNQSGAEGEVTITGSGSTITATLNAGTGDYLIGSAGGTGTLNILAGATATTGGLVGDVSLGEGLGSSGTFNIDAPGSNAVMDDLQVGLGGVGFMNITGGGLVDQAVGSEPDAQIAMSDLSANIGAGTVVVNGDGSRWNFRQGEIGSAGLGSVAVEAGGRIASTADVTVGVDSTSQGSLHVTGVGTLADSLVSVGGDLIVGELGQGTLTVDQGGDVTVGNNLHVGDDPSNLNNNAVTITDPGSSLTVTERLEVGREGMGTLNVTGGGTTSSQALVAGQSLGSTGIITLSGVGSSATAVGTGIGTFGTGALTISAGAHLETARLWVGFADDSDSTVDINGTGSTLTVTGLNQLPVSLRIGGHDTLEGGTGTVTISAGGTIVAGRENRIGTSLGSVGSLTVTGPTSLADFNDGGTDNTTVVGHAGEGTLSILDGGRVESNMATIGQLAGADGTVDVGNGNAPANWNVGGSLYVGGSASAAGGTGRLNINSQGTVTVAGELKIWDDGEFFLSGGTLNVGNGFALGVGSSLNGTGSIYAETSQALGSNIIASGNLTVGDSNSVAGFLSDGEMQINNHTVTLNDSDQAVLGSLTRIGSGGADGVLSASNGIFLEAGKTLVGRGEVTTSNDEFSSQGFVQGEGVGITFNHLVTGEGAFGGQVAFEGGYSPGNSAALVELENVEFGSANVLTIELGGLDRGTEYDALDVSGLINIDGILHAQLIDSFVPSLGNVFEVIAFGGRTGDFTTYSGLDLGNGTALLPEFTVDSLLLTVVVPTEPEDLNMDGFVDSLDLGILLGNWGLSVPPVGGELDARPPIDGQDLGILLGAWNPPPLASTSFVPEPSALLLGAMASVAMMLRRRR